MSLRTARGFAGALVAALGLATIGAPSHATSVMPLTVVDLLSHSQTIVAGQVQSVTDGFDARGLPYTEVTIKVDDNTRLRVRRDAVREVVVKTPPPAAPAPAK